MNTRLATAAMIALSLGACDREAPDPEPLPNATESPDAQATASIFSPEAGIESEEVLLEPLRAVVGFPQGDSYLDAAALKELATVLQSEQVTQGGRILLRGHSDAGGTDAANLRASKARADAVRDWLIEKGVASSRIEVIAFGEQNPIEPNAKPDGTPNEAGRALNRRVSVTVGVPNDTQSLTEQPEEIEEEPTPEPTSEALFPLTD